MKSIHVFLQVFALMILPGCSKDENDIKDTSPVAAASSPWRLTKVLNFSTSSDTEPYSFMEVEYDVHGNKVRESLYDYPNTLFTFNEFSYENNQLKEKRVYDGAVGNLQLGTYTRYTYDKSSLIKEEVYLSDGTLRLTTHYEYNGNNLVNTYKETNDLGIHHQTKYTYNNNNLVILEESYMYNQALEEFRKYYYDGQMRLIKTETYNPNGSVIQTQEQYYLGNSPKPSELRFYNSNGMLSWEYQYLYDGLNNLTETREIGEGTTHTLEKNKYEENRLIEHIQYIPSFGYSEWFVIRYEYEKIP